MGLNKPITVGGGLTAAEVQSIIDAQTTAIAGKVDAQTNTLKTDIPSSISGGASISDINAALDEKLPQYQNGTVVKSKQVVNAPSISLMSAYKAAYPNYTIGKYTYWCGGDSRAIVNELAGYLVLTPVDKSKTLVKSAANDLYENRDLDSGMIERDFTLTIDNTKYNTNIDGSIRYVLTDLTVKDETMCVIEFN